MSLFERIKNIRYDLQEKRKFPGDESGAYKQAKDDLEARKGFKKNKPGGLKADERNPYVKRSVRKTRVDNLGGDIYDQPKFSQKKFEKTLKKSSKGPRTGIVDPFGPGDTPGQQKVKAMDAKAFKVTQAKDVKQTKGYKTYDNLSKEIKDLKKSNRKVSNQIQSKGVNQADVSKKIAKDNEVYNQTRKASGYSQANKPKPGSEPTVFKPKVSNTQVVDEIPAGSNLNTATKSGSKPKGTRTITTTIPKKGKEYNPRTITKTRKVKSTIFNPPDVSKTKGPQLPKFLNMRTGNINVGKTKGAVDYSKLSPANRSFARTASAMVQKVPKPLQKVASGVAKTGLKLGRFGRLGVAGGLISTALSPAGRRFIGTALLGGGLGYLANRKGPPKLKVGDGITKTSNLPSKFQPKDAKNLSYVDTYGKKRKLGSGDVRFKFGLTGTKSGGKPGGMQYNKQDMARVKNIQKRYIDSYNASVKGNPFKKQIKYSVNKDGTYTVTPPKKK